MTQKMENTYIFQQKDDFYADSAHKEIYMEYPFSHSVKMVNNEINKQLLIRELAELWLINIQNVLRPSSYARYQAYTSKYILPYIGELKAGVFNKEDLSALLGFLQAGNGKTAPLSQYTVYVVESMVRAMFHYAVEKKLVPEVIFGKAGYMIKNKKDAMPLSELEIQQLLVITTKQEIDIQLQVMLPLYTGVSLSELCGLKWEDIDLRNGEIHIHRNLMRVQQKKSSGKSESKDITNNCDRKAATVLKEFELPKNECRKFVIPEKLNIFLEKTSGRIEPEKERYVVGINKNVSRPETKYARPDSRTLQNHLKMLGKQAWISELTFKRLRDTFAVMCLQAGGDLYSVAYVLGVGINAVYDRYGQWLVRDDGFLKKLV